jgi:hypothetical protein
VVETANDDGEETTLPDRQPTPTKVKIPESPHVKKFKKSLQSKKSTVKASNQSQGLDTMTISSLAQKQASSSALDFKAQS